MTYLHRIEPSALPAAWRAFRCFEPYGEDEQKYARATAFVLNSCEAEVVDLLAQVRAWAPRHRDEGRETFFEVEQNAFVVKNAESYYRAMVRGGPESWNLRDRHMADTRDRLVRYHGPAAKAIAWEHNTDVGDARFTHMTDDGMFNLGQLARQRHEAEGVVLVGFGSYRGAVIAAEGWDGYKPKVHQHTGHSTTAPDGAPSFQGHWHTYGLLWTAEGYTFYLDGAEQWKTNKAVSKRSEYLLLTCEIEDKGWAGDIPAGGYGPREKSTTTMEVDWVRVWQLPAAGTERVVFEDALKGKPAGGWEWLRENPKAWRPSEKGLEIRVEPGLGGTVKNALVGLH
jgi:hypothetical protein